jgi:hypothetical protein
MISLEKGGHGLAVAIALARHAKDHHRARLQLLPEAGFDLGIVRHFDTPSYFGMKAERQ